MALPQLVYSSVPTLPQGLKPAYFSALDGTAEALAEKVDTRRSAPKEASDFEGLAPSLKRCPDKNLSFSASCEAVPYPKTQLQLTDTVMPVYP
jgi:hypothetical protein